jgi:hypothetical protein
LDQCKSKVERDLLEKLLKMGNINEQEENIV